mmetsp:Transcript_3456/g.11094  ORF Transcript_3456/g.11094 Transcript_3456/m.11094 type:complete len:330 (+) Transcript_3456:140-1129(+)
MRSSRPRTSSRSSGGDTAATALASSFRETVPVSLLGSMMALNRVLCSSSSWTPALDSAAPNSARLRRRTENLPLGPPPSMCCSACRMDLHPRATSFFRKSSMLRTGAAASTAVWNSDVEMKPFLSMSRNSKILMWSSRDSPPICLLRKRLNSQRVSSLLPVSAMKELKALVMVGNLSRIIFRKKTDRSVSVPSLLFPPTLFSAIRVETGRFGLVVRADPVSGVEACDCSLSFRTGNIEGTGMFLKCVWRAKDRTLLVPRRTDVSSSTNCPGSPCGLRGKITSRTAAVGPSSGSGWTSMSSLLPFFPGLAKVLLSVWPRSGRLSPFRAVV